MLDHDIKEQLVGVFSKLTNEIELSYMNSDHPKQAELIEMLDDVASTSALILLTPSEENSPYPQFSVGRKGQEKRITFSGIPGGHEFTSLILSILNSDLKGKIPDQGIIQRIRQLKGPIHLQTYISLSCENCPEVVQALNLMAILHPQITHQMRDGEFFQQEIEKLNIQGVPSVISNDQLISSGKIDLMGLIVALEKNFGINEGPQQDVNFGHFDVVVIGSGPAGASAAIYAARKGLKTAVIAERIGGQVKDTKGIENLISVPYTEGPLLAEQLATHLRHYDISILEHRRVLHIENSHRKEITLESREKLSASAVIVATGAKWRQLGIEGEKDYIGRGVAFCPHCDGPFYKGKDIAVIGGGNSGVEAAIDLSGIVKSVTLYEFMPELKADRVLIEKLKSLPNVKIVTNAKTQKVIGNQQKVTGLEFENRETGAVETQQLEGIFVQIGLMPNSQFISNLVETNRMGEIVIDEKCRTSMAGIYAAGDVTTVPYKQIIISMGEGAKAALAAFEELKLH